MTEDEDEEEDALLLVAVDPVVVRDLRHAAR